MLQQLAEERLADGVSLLGSGRWSAAYFLAGYAVECGLKSCVLRVVENNPGIIFQTRHFSSECWTHDLTNLVRLAGLDAALLGKCRIDRQFETEWLIVRRWNESSRYAMTPEAEARAMVSAVDDPTNAILNWIRAHW